MRFQLSVRSLRPLLFVLGARPETCYAELEGGVVRARMGAYRVELPVADIREVAPTPWPWYGGLGVRLGPRGKLAFVGERQGVVRLRFGNPHPARLPFLFLFKIKVRDLYLSLQEPDRFMGALRELGAGTVHEATAP